MATISLNWNGETLDRTFIELNQEDEISVAQFFGNLKEVPLLDPLSDLPLGIKVVIYVLSVWINLGVIQNYGILDGTKSNDVQGLSSMKGRRRTV